MVLKIKYSQKTFRRFIVRLRKKVKKNRKRSDQIAATIEQTKKEISVLHAQLEAEVDPHKRVNVEYRVATLENYTIPNLEQLLLGKLGLAL